MPCDGAPKLPLVESPRRTLCVGPCRPTAMALSRQGRARRGLRAGRRHKRVPQELGRPVSSPGVMLRSWRPDYELQARGCAFWTVGSETTGAPPGIAKRRQRSAVRGTAGVAHLHSTVEAGEPVPRGPCGGKGDVRQGTVGGTPAGGFVPWSRVNVTPTDSISGTRQSLTGRTGCLPRNKPILWTNEHVRRLFLPVASRLRPRGLFPRNRPLDEA
jgi:hypothetical protein